MTLSEAEEKIMGLNPGDTFFVKCPFGSTFTLPCFERQYYSESDEYKMFILVFLFRLYALVGVSASLSA